MHGETWLSQKWLIQLWECFSSFKCEGPIVNQVHWTFYNVKYLQRITDLLSDNYSRFYTLITIVKLIMMGTSLLSPPADHIVNNSAQIVSTKNRLRPTLMSSQPAAENKKASVVFRLFLFELLAIKIPSSLSLSLKLSHRGGSVAQQRPGELSWR